MLSKQQLNSYWMPFTANRDYKEAPRIVASASGMFYRDQNGREILDATAGLWCVPLGHSHPTIVKAVQDAVATLDYAPAFQMGHPGAFEFAAGLRACRRPVWTRCFREFRSEAVDTALKWR